MYRGKDEVNDVRRRHTPAEGPTWGTVAHEQQTRPLWVAIARFRVQVWVVNPDDDAAARTIATQRWVALPLTLLSALCALGGGAALLAAGPKDDTFPLSWLRHSPFDSFLIPGLLLLGIVGGSSLVATLLLARRSTYSLDATLFAGGVLTVWIVDEIALIRSAHFLHSIFAALGLLMVGVALSASFRSGAARMRWVAAVTASEAFGFLVPILAGMVAHGWNWSENRTAMVMVAAGIVEGFVMGLGQALALPFAVRRMRFALLTAAGAGFTWALAMSMLTIIKHDTPMHRGLLAVLALLAIALGLSSIGVAQWVELRRHRPRAAGWIGWTTLAWTLALPLSFLPGPLVDGATPVLSHLILWGSGGLLMAYVMALVTWHGVQQLRDEEQTGRSGVSQGDAAPRQRADNDLRGRNGKKIQCGQ